MTQKAFGEYFDIPARSIQNWEGGQRNCPEYLLDLMEYKLKNEGIIRGETKNEKVLPNKQRNH
jgi:DNA-binding transcriptional regulator YiaG